MQLNIIHIHRERERERVLMRDRYVTQHFALVGCCEQETLLYRFVINPSVPVVEHDNSFFHC